MPLNPAENTAKKKEKGEKKKEKKRRRKREKKEDFLWDGMSSSTNRCAERVAPKVPRGAKFYADMDLRSNIPQVCSCRWRPI